MGVLSSPPMGKLPRQPQGGAAAKALCCTRACSQAPMGVLPRPWQAQGQGSPPPWAFCQGLVLHKGMHKSPHGRAAKAPRGHAAKAKAAPMGKLPRHAAKAMAAPMGVLPRPWHAQGMQPRPRQPPNGRSAKPLMGKAAKATPRGCCCQGLVLHKGMQPSPHGRAAKAPRGRAAKAKAAPMAAAKALACTRHAAKAKAKAKAAPPWAFCQGLVLRCTRACSQAPMGMPPGHPAGLTSGRNGQRVWMRLGGMEREGGGTNRSDTGLNLSGSWQQGHSATYNTPSRI